MKNRHSKVGLSSFELFTTRAGPLDGTRRLDLFAPFQNTLYISGWERISIIQFVTHSRRVVKNTSK